MTTPFLAAQAVRDFGGITGTTGQYSDGAIGSNLRASASLLEKLTRRYFANQPSVTKTFTTEGRAQVYIGGLRTANPTVTIAGASLVLNTTFWLLPDVQQTGVSMAIQMRPFTTYREPWYYAVPEWFDRNLDNPRYANYYSSIPNDLSITGDWGYTPETVPDAYLQAEKALAYYLTKRPDAILSGALTTPEGNIFDLSAMPLEVQSFVAEWKAGEQAVTV